MTTLSCIRTLLHPVRRLRQPAQVGTKQFWSTTPPPPEPSSGDDIAASKGSNRTAESYSWNSLVKEVAAENDLSIAKSEQIVHTVFDSIAEVRVDEFYELSLPLACHYSFYFVLSSSTYCYGCRTHKYFVNFSQRYIDVTHEFMFH